MNASTVTSATIPGNHFRARPPANWVIISSVCADQLLAKLTYGAIYEIITVNGIDHFYYCASLETFLMRESATNVCFVPVDLAEKSAISYVLRDPTPLPGARIL